jgi:transcriptional regulator with XRE-family HTH domain
MSPLAEYRRANNLSLEDCAVALGLKPSTKGFLSRIENGEEHFSIRLALRAQAWSRGELQVLELISEDDRKLFQDAAAFGRVAA